MKEKKYAGVVVPLITPFTEKREIDPAGTERLIEHVVSHNCHPFILGTTGEALSVSLAMKKDFIKKAVEANKGRKTFYAGISSMCLEDSVYLAKIFFDSGVDVAVAHLPGYYALSPVAMLRYFTELAGRIDGPLMLYNIKSTTHMSIPVEVVQELAGHPNIIGLKDSERDKERIHRLLDIFKDDPGFSYMLGWAGMSMEFLQSGGDGIVPSTANAFPQLYYRLYQAVAENDADTAAEVQELTDKLSLLYQKDKLLSEAIPGLKAILEYLGICLPYVLPPCYASEQQEKEKMITTLKEIEKRL